MGLIDFYNDIVFKGKMSSTAEESSEDTGEDSGIGEGLIQATMDLSIESDDSNNDITSRVTSSAGEQVPITEAISDQAPHSLQLRPSVSELETLTTAELMVRTD